MLPKDHALATLLPSDGFNLKGEGVAFPTIEAIRLAMNADGAASAIQSPGVYGPAILKPLRKAIPYTEGRLANWKLVEQVTSAKARNWPGIKRFEFNGQSIAICGGGPSLGESIHELRALQKSGTKVMAINRTHDYLLDLPQSHKIPWIKPWAGIILEPIPHAANYMRPTQGVRYYVGSQCHSDTFDQFERNEHYVWHAQSKPELIPLLTKEELQQMVPAIGSTCGLRAVILAYMLGFTEIHLFGFDSCYRTEDVLNGIRGGDGSPKLHAYAKPEAIHDFRELVIKGFVGGDRRYFGNTNMLAQADEFQQFMALREKELNARHMDPHQILVHGFGVIPDMAREFGVHVDNFNHERKAA